MAFEERSVTCISDLLESLEYVNSKGRLVWFRGHADGKWKLEPTLARKRKLEAEAQITKRFKQNAFQFLAHAPTAEWEWMFLMQHYGAPTRLLDWTENPLVALYFALDETGFEPKVNKPEASVWALFPTRLNEISGIAMKTADDVPAFGDDGELDDYLPSRARQGSASKNPIAILATRQFGRVVAQQGVFTVMHKESRPIESLQDANGGQDHVVKLTIRRSHVHHFAERAKSTANQQALCVPATGERSRGGMCWDMSDFDCNELNDSTVMLVYLDRQRIFLDPEYQRQSEVWNFAKKQLLIDSLINGFDIPKIYFHEYEKAEKHGGLLRKYAIVDGKQRLAAIWDFLDGKYPLSGDFEYLKDNKVKLAGLTYQQLSIEHPAIQARFTGRRLSVVTIRTVDTELIEDMFSRLNEAVPLNAAEKRNAFGGPIPKIIRDLVKQDYFTEKTVISERRYRHYDLACKFLITEEEGKITETKKAKLDAFVHRFADQALNRKATELGVQVRNVMLEMSLFFRDQDPLLRSPSSSMTYYILFRNGILARPDKCGLSRNSLVDFENLLRDNRELAQEDSSEADFGLLKYDRLNQSPNDASAIEYRVQILTIFLQDQKPKKKRS